MIKNLVKSFLHSRGYRLVPRALDAKTLYERLLAEDFQTVIDVGAHEGKTVEQWINDFPHAHVHAFEPSPSSFQTLQKVAQRTPDRVTAWNSALGATDETATLHLHSDHTSSSSLLPRTDYCAEVMPVTRVEVPVDVAVRRLDTVLENAHFAEPALLKLDVQGYEDKVLAGATNTLKRVKFVLSEISIAPVYEDQCDFDKLHVLLSQNGFRFIGFLEQFHLQDGTPVYADVVYTK
jgi:FkbM family methyltransferase